MCEEKSVRQCKGRSQFPCAAAVRKSEVLRSVPSPFLRFGLLVDGRDSGRDAGAVSRAAFQGWLLNVAVFLPDFPC